MKHNLKTLNKYIADNGHSDNTEITRKNKTYYVLHICRNDVPVPLFYSKKSKDIFDYIKLHYKKD